MKTKRLSMQVESNVRALLNTEGWPAEAIDPSKPKKWQTRRVCKEQPVAIGGVPDWATGETVRGYGIYGCAIQGTAALVANQLVRDARYQPGEVLAVGEKLVRWADSPLGPMALYAADQHAAKRDGALTRWPWKNDVLPSRYMPCWAARMWVQVMAVRVEQLQEITAEDALAEGLLCPDCHNTGTREYWVGADPYGEICPHQQMDALFADLWTGIHGPGSWDENPWVEVDEIMRVERPNGISQG